jgi:hypothetical protein
MHRSRKVFRLSPAGSAFQMIQADALYARHVVLEHAVHTDRRWRIVLECLDRDFRFCDVAETVSIGFGFEDAGTGRDDLHPVIKPI